MKKIPENLLKILICPKCSGELAFVESEQHLLCLPCELSYPIKNGIPIMIIEEAKKIDETTNFNDSELDAIS